MIVIRCSECGKKLHVPEKFLGQWGTCKHCGKKIQVLVPPLKFSKDVYETEDEEPREKFASVTEYEQIEPHASKQNADIPFHFSEEHCVTNEPQQVPPVPTIPPPIQQSVNRPNLWDSFGQMGKVMVGCGCFLLVAPLMLFTLAVFFQILIGTNKTEPSPPQRKAISQVQAPTYKVNEPTVTLPDASNASLSFDTLEIGEYYKFSGKIPLMPEFEPSGYVETTSALAQIVTFEGELNWVLIRGRRYKGTTPWYEVNVFDLHGSQWGSGWINSTAIMSKSIIKPPSTNTQTTYPNTPTSPIPAPSLTTTHQPPYQAPVSSTQPVTVYITPTGQAYHRLSCRTLSQTPNPTGIDLESARSKYRPCEVCNPPH